MRRPLGLLVVTIAAAIAWPLAASAGSHQATKAGQKAGQAAQAGGNAAAEKTLQANERAVNEAVMKGDAAGFQALVAPDSWSIDPMGGRASTADFVKQFDAMTKEMKMTSWDLTDFQTYWVNPNVAVLTYKWTGQGTYQGQPIPSPVWASTVWARRGGKWQAVFHQESPAGPPPK